MKVLGFLPSIQVSSVFPILGRRTKLALFYASTPKLPLIRLQIKAYSCLGSSDSQFLSERRRVNSEQIISLFKANGFTEEDIAKVTRNRPKTFLTNPQILAPKIDFLLSTGISNTDLNKILVNHPSILESSLKDRLIPRIHYLKSLLHSDENVVRVIKRYPMILYCRIEKDLAPNISLLSELGVAASRIKFMLRRSPGAFLMHHTNFKSKVEEAIRLGFDPTSASFTYAILSLCSSSKENFERKWAVYKKWNLSDDEIRMAFRSNPICMTLSEEKITRGMDFLVNKMGIDAAKIATSPGVLSYDLENRTIPRCRVIQVLKSKGILKEVSMTTILLPTETYFLARYVTKYENQLPELLDIYNGKKEYLETKIAF